jgi:hypothetical protein
MILASYVAGTENGTIPGGLTQRSNFYRERGNPSFQMVINSMDTRFRGYDGLARILQNWYLGGTSKEC